MCRVWAFLVFCFFVFVLFFLFSLKINKRPKPAGRSGRGRAVKQLSQSPACLFQRGAQHTRSLCNASSCGACMCGALGSEGRGDAQRAAFRARLLTGALLNKTQTRGPPSPELTCFSLFPPLFLPAAEPQGSVIPGAKGQTLCFVAVSGSCS